MWHLILDIYKILKIIVVDKNEATAKRLIDEKIDALENAIAGNPPKSCEWKLQGMVYEADCGLQYQFNEGDLEFNGFIYCPSCGKKIKDASQNSA